MEHKQVEEGEGEKHREMQIGEEGKEQEEGREYLEERRTGSP